MRLQTLIAIGFTCLISAAALGQDAEQTKLLAKRAAEADAYRKLAEAVYGIQLNSRTYVKDFVTESDEVRGDIDTFVRGIRLGAPTFYDDGSCEVPAEVTVAKIVETLRESHSRHYKGDDIKTEDFESISRRTEKSVIKVIGMGAPRAELPPGLPEGVADQLGPAPGGASSGPPAIPDIWKKVGPQARLLAVEAARKDAQRRLAERIKGLRLTARTQVRDFVTESDEIRTEMDAMLVGAQEVGRPFYHTDELIVEVTMRVPTEQVVTMIKQLHSRHYKGDEVKGTDVESIVKNVVKRDFEATGMGVPRKDAIQRYAQAAQVQLPPWAADAIEAQGSGTDPEFNTPQGRLRAARAAEMDARRKLAEAIAGLTLQSATTVRDFTTDHDEIGAQVDAVIVGAEIVDTKFADDTATVRIRLPGMQVWGVVNDPLSRKR